MIARGLLPLPRGFVNRVVEVGALTEAIGHARSAGTQGVFVLSGLPGVGKTVLAAHVAGLIRTTFEHGSLCVRMGASADANSVDEALTFLLIQLGVERLPTTSQELRARFQAETADRELLLVIDDVGPAAQLTNLLPASSRSVVLATSRRRSEGFARERYRVIDVPVFDRDSAAAMIRADIGANRPDAEEREIQALAELCGYLPLAMSVAGAQLVTRHRGPIADYLERLERATSRIAQLTIDGERPVEAIFEISYQDLAEAERRAYRLLSLHPGTQFALTTAAAAMGCDVDEAEVLLEALVTANLLSVVGERRYELHSLVRDHAAALAREQEHPADLRAATARIGAHYLDFAVAREQVFSNRPHFGPRFDGQVPLAYDGEDAWLRAAADFDLERPNLRRAVRMALDERLDQLAWQLGEAMVTYLFQRDLSDDAIDIYSTGLVAARRIQEDPADGDARPLLRMHAELGTAYFSAKDNDRALEQFDQALALADRLPAHSEAVLVTTAKTLVWKAFDHSRRGAVEQAVVLVERARLLMEDPNFPERMRARELAVLDMNSGPMFASVDRHADAIAAGERAIAYLKLSREKHNAAKAVANLGESLAKAGAPYRERAISTLTEAVDLLARFGILSWEAHSSELLGELFDAAGQSEQARVWHGRAEELRDRLAGK
ncbi:hypothetical protein GCM10022247_39360 [Allokutzneria multivorans]|uniref:AAA+ ATPase domain-containing protein n=1 Tax=Allokutzneria multivorans TaxID=1142134 RepID=A0ABP7SKH8_9PSEU